MQHSCPEQDRQHSEATKNPSGKDTSVLRAQYGIHPETRTYRKQKGGEEQNSGMIKIDRRHKKIEKTYERRQLQGDCDKAEGQDNKSPGLFLSAKHNSCDSQ